MYKKLIICMFVVLPLTAVAQERGGDCNGCWGFADRDTTQRWQGNLLLMQQRAAARAEARAGAFASVGGGVGGAALAQAQAIGNQNTIIVNGDGNSIVLNADQSNVNSGQSASNTVSDNNLQQEILNIDGDYLSTTNVTKYKNTYENRYIDIDIDTINNETNNKTIEWVDNQGGLK